MNKTGKKFLIFLLSVMLVLSVVLVACSNNVSYTITVLLPNKSPAAQVTVSLQKDGKTVASAQTDEQGVAVVSAQANKYSVVLSDLPAGYGFYNEITTNTLGTPITLHLEQEKMQYKVSVKLPDGQAVSNATVVWSNLSEAFSAKTDESGVATQLLLADSYTVTLEDLPDDYYLSDLVTVTAAQPVADLVLAVDIRLEYTVSVVTEGGLHYPNMEIVALQDGQRVASAKTDSDGVATLKLLEGTYTIDAHIPEGYYTEFTRYTVTPENRSADILISSLVLPWEAPAGTKYTIGSIMHDFTISTFDGNTVNLAELLENKKAVVLNFWYTTCSWCAREFPIMWQAYQQFSDDLEIVAIDPYRADYCYKYATAEDNKIAENNAIAAFRSQAGIADATFPMGMDNGYYGSDVGVASKFSFEGYPTTIIIDRYGAVAMLHSGAILQESTWNNLFATYTSDNYIQTFVPGETETEAPPVEIEKPNVEMPDSAELEKVANNTESGFTFSYRPETETTDSEYSWPWIVGEKDGVQAIVPSNSGHNSSFATVHTDVTLAAGQAVAFDFFSSTEYNADVLYVLVDGMVQFQISGLSGIWGTCFAYVAEEEGVYDICLLYYKDDTFLDGDDTVYVRNMRLCNATDIDVQTDIMRSAVSDWDGNDGYLNKVVPVMNEDGFYRVNSQDGPYLLMDVAHTTNWSNANSLVQYIYAEDENFCMLDMDGDGVDEDCKALLEQYIRVAVMSDIYGMIPVDAQCQKLFEALMDKIAMKMEHRHLHEDEWLEVCRYITRYGTEQPMPNPVIGLTDTSALTANIGKNTMTLLKEVVPCSGLIYKFIPSESGVYHFYSVGNNETQIFLYDNRGIDNGLLAYNGDDNLGRFESDDNDNFNMYRYLEAGKTYFLKVAYYFSGMTGSFDFYLENVGETYTVLENLTPGFHVTDNTEDDTLSGNLVLNFLANVVLKRDGVFYTVNKDGSLSYTTTAFTGEAENGKYYVVNADNSLTPVLVDFVGFTRCNPYMALNRIIKSWYLDPKEYTDTNFHPFDFTKYLKLDENEDIVFDENGKVVVVATDGQDYTNRMWEIYQTADEDGFVQATEELVRILTLYCQREMFGLANDWMMFCRYYRTYSALDVQ